MAGRPSSKAKFINLTEHTLAEILSDSRRLTMLAEKLLRQMEKLRGRIADAKQIQARAKDNSQ